MAIDNPLTMSDARAILAAGIPPKDVVQKLVSTRTWSRLSASAVVWFLTQDSSGGLHRF